MTKTQKIGIVIAFLSITSISCVAIWRQILNQLNPTWTEVYSYENNTLIVTREEWEPYGKGRMTTTGELLVVQVTGQTDWQGGWGCSEKAPSAGEGLPGSPKEQFAVNSFVSASDGKVPFKPFVIQGQGRKGLTVGHRKNGFVKLLFYKRGFQLREEVGRVNKIQVSQTRVFDLRESSPLKNGVDEVLKLLCPFDFADTEIQKTYWNHSLPNGMTIKDYALNEMEDILKTLTDENERARVNLAMARIRSEDFTSYRALRK